MPPETQTTTDVADEGIEKLLGLVDRALDTSLDGEARELIYDDIQYGYDELLEGFAARGEPLGVAAVQAALSIHHAAASALIASAEAQVEVAAQRVAQMKKRGQGRLGWLEARLHDQALAHRKLTKSGYLDFADGTRVQLTNHKAEWRIKDKGAVIAWLSDNDADAYEVLVEREEKLDGTAAKKYINALESGEFVPGTEKTEDSTTSTIKRST